MEVRKNKTWKTVQEFIPIIAAIVTIIGTPIAVVQNCSHTDIRENNNDSKTSVAGIVDQTQDNLKDSIVNNLLEGNTCFKIDTTHSSNSAAVFPSILIDDYPGSLVSVPLNKKEIRRSVRHIRSQYWAEIRKLEAPRKEIRATRSKNRMKVQIFRTILRLSVPDRRYDIQSLSSIVVPFDRKEMRKVVSMIRLQNKIIKNDSSRTRREKHLIRRNNRSTIRIVRKEWSIKAYDTLWIEGTTSQKIKYAYCSMSLFSKLWFFMLIDMTISLLFVILAYFRILSQGESIDDDHQSQSKEEIIDSESFAQLAIYFVASVIYVLVYLIRL